MAACQDTSRQGRPLTSFSAIATDSWLGSCTATASRPAIASTMSSEEHMNEPVVPVDTAGSRGEATPARDVASQSAGAKTAAKTEQGSSTYATGGGGVSFAHRVATVYLASILTQTRRTEA